MGDQEVESGEIRVGLAAAIEREWKIPSLVVWGPGEEGIAREVVAASEGAARLAPRTSLRELVPYKEGAPLCQR